MMSKRAAAGSGVAAVLLVALGACIYATSWDNMNDEPTAFAYNGEAGQNAPSNMDDAGNLKTNSLNYGVFEAYGPLLIVLALLMFGAMVGGICVAREEVENDDTD